jgi:acylphosphatase
MRAFSFSIRGKVQGVFYRARTKDKADELGLKGWVRNMPDGSVEIHAEGPDGQLKELEEWCWQGPPAAEVTSVMVKEAADEGHPSFEIQKL